MVDFMQKAWQAKFYGSKAWQVCRDVAIKRDRYLCQDCLKLGRITPAEEVHHIVELNAINVDDESVSLNLDNLVSLCRRCHRARHGDREPRYIVDELGRATVIR